MSIDRVIALYPGFHFEGELRMLNRLADGVTEGVIVCIGSYRGQTDCAIALHAHVPVYCIDDRSGSIGEDYPFGDIDRMYWMQNILDLGLAEKVRPINLKSHDVAQVWDKPVGMLFIDGSHDANSVTQDLDDWLKHVVDGGLVAMHDANTPGIIESVKLFSRLELIEQADITNVYRWPGGQVWSAPALYAEIEMEPIITAKGSAKPKLPRKKTSK